MGERPGWVPDDSDLRDYLLALAGPLRDAMAAERFDPSVPVPRP